ncbi:MAG: TIR domain-containing protein, partial [Pikeienuella sp.]
MADIPTRDFFISFTDDDKALATALNDALRAAGYSVWFHPVDKPAFAGIAQWMVGALNASRRMICVCSTTYFSAEKGYSAAERNSIFMEDPTNSQALLMLIKAEEFDIPRPFNQCEFLPVIGMLAAEAAAKLLSILKTDEQRAAMLAADALRRSRRHPDIFHVPGGKIPYFAGRDIEMARLHESLGSAGATAVTAVAGMGGIGKTTLAREYAHRFGVAARYGGVWWVEAETEGQIVASLDRLAKRVGAEDQTSNDQRASALAAREWLGAQVDA